MQANNELTSSTLQKLRFGAGTADQLTVPTIATNTETGFGPVRIALGEQQEARLLLPLGARERSSNLLGTEVLGIRVVKYTVDGRASPFIELTCHDKRLEPLFLEIIDEIRRRITRGETSVQACSSTIEDYRALLATAKEGPTLEVVAGLIAELLLLDRLLDISSDAWQAWRGPQQDRHDFRVANIAIEVKAGLRRLAGSVRISSIEQLMSPEGGELFLQHVQLEETSAGLIRFADLAERCCEKSSNAVEVRKLLSELGCSEPHAPAWNHRNFNLESTRMFRVAEGFPMILPQSFLMGSPPLGVQKIQYSVDLNQAAELRLSLNEEAVLLRRLVDCLSQT